VTKFIQIKEQVYRIPNKIIIGRGEPFTVLNGDQSVSRAHAILLCKDGKWYLKNLNNSETFINGNRTRAKKFVELQLNDEILLGTSRLKLLESEPASNYIIVKRSTNDLSKNKQLLFIKWTYVLIFLASMLSFVGHKNFSFLTALFVIGLVGVFLSVVYLFLKRCIKKVAPKEITVAEDGFTIHFHNDSNMTFKRNDISYWAVWPWLQSVVVLTKKMNISISIKDHGVVLDFLTNHVLEKKGRTPWWRIAMGLSAIQIFFLNTESYTFNLVSLSLIGIGGAVGVYCGARYEEGWKQKITVIPGGILFSILSILNYYPEPVFRVNQLQMKCIDGDTQSCKSIDFYALEKDPVYTYYLHKNILAKSCESKNESACHYFNEKQNSRKVAGEKKK
jgi:hypothetical protein